MSKRNVDAAIPGYSEEQENYRCESGPAGYPGQTDIQTERYLNQKVFTHWVSRADGYTNRKISQ
jgi:hypothetical protein